MPRHHVMLALVTVLGSAPLLSPAFADEATEPASTVAPTQPLRMGRTIVTPSPLTATPRAEFTTPATPVPMNLPDDATEAEVSGGYGIGVASLAFVTVLIVALVLGGFYFLACRSWSTAH